jgi:hypothetical protein
MYKLVRDDGELGAWKRPASEGGPYISERFRNQRRRGSRGENLGIAGRTEDGEGPNARDCIATSRCGRAIEKACDSMETEEGSKRGVVKISSAVGQGMAERVVNVGAEPE